jgi:hypothetical protein
MVKTLRVAFLHGSSMILVMGAPSAATAQPRLAPPNPQQERCIEAFADTQQEKAIREKVGEPPQEALDEWVNEDKEESLYAWATKRAIAVFGSEEAAYAANEKMRIEKHTRRFELLRRNAKEGHLPSLQLLASHYWGKWVQDIPGLPTPEERSAAYRTLHDQRFPLAAGALAAECREAVREMIKIMEDDADALDARAREALKARRRAEIAIKQEECVALWREAGFRGDMYAWETLAAYDLTTFANPVGIVPPVEHYAWLELDKLRLREDGNNYNLPRKHQERLAKDFMNEEQRRDARALAEKYAQIIWPRRIPKVKGEQYLCRLIPQFSGDAEPYGADPSPR